MDVSAARPIVHNEDARQALLPVLRGRGAGTSPGPLLRDIATLGLPFEGPCLCDLRSYAMALNGGVFHCHDGSGLEADAVFPPIRPADLV